MNTSTIHQFLDMKAEYAEWTQISPADIDDSLIASLVIADAINTLNVDIENALTRLGEIYKANQ